MRFVYVIAVLMLIVGTSSGFSAGQSPPATIGDGLERLPNARVQLAYVRPNTDWTKYRTIQLGTLQIPLQVRDGAPPGETPRFGESYVLRDKDVAALQAAYDESMRNELSKAGFTFVTTPGPDTLIVAAKIINIRLAAPISGSRMESMGRGRTYSQGGGTIAIAAVFADGGTSQVIAEVADRSYQASVWGINNSVSNLFEAKQAFRKWGSQLRERLTERRAPH